MKTICQILTFVFLVAFIGHLTQGNFFIGGFILICVCGYFGFLREDSKPQAQDLIKNNAGGLEVKATIPIRANADTSNDEQYIYNIEPDVLDKMKDNPMYLASIKSLYQIYPTESSAFNFLKVLIYNEQHHNLLGSNPEIDDYINIFTYEYPTQLGFFFLAISYYVTKSNAEKSLYYLERLESLHVKHPLLFNSAELKKLEECKLIRVSEKSNTSNNIIAKNIRELQTLHNQSPASSGLAFKLLYEKVKVELSKDSTKPNFEIDKLIDEFLYTKFPTYVEMHFLGITYYLKKDNFYAAEKIACLLSKKGHEGVVNLTSEQMSTIFQTLDEIKNKKPN